jgi:hypothetical protein
MRYSGSLIHRGPPGGPHLNVEVVHCILRRAAGKSQEAPHPPRPCTPLGHQPLCGARLNHELRILTPNVRHVHLTPPVGKAHVPGELGRHLRFHWAPPSSASVHPFSLCPSPLSLSPSLSHSLSLSLSPLVLKFSSSSSGGWGRRKATKAKFDQSSLGSLIRIHQIPYQQTSKESPR